MSIYYINCYAKLNQLKWTNQASANIRKDVPDKNFYQQNSNEFDYPIGYGDNRYSALLKFDTSSIDSYKKKKINSILLVINAQFYGSQPIGNVTDVGGSLSWLYSAFDATTVTYNSKPQSKRAFVKYAKGTSNWSDYSIPIQYYNQGFIGYDGEPAPRNLYDQLGIGFWLSNEVPENDYTYVMYACGCWRASAYITDPDEIFEKTDARTKFSFTFEDWSPTLTARSPISNAYINPFIPNLFSVSFGAFDSIDYPTAQTITYEAKDLSTESVTSHTASVSINLRNRTYVEWTVPANTFPSGKNWQWRAKITTDDGETGFSDWANFTTADATPTAPTIVSPQSKYLVGADAITLTWKHNVTTGSSQYAYDLQYRQAGDWTNIAAHTVSSAQSYTLASNFFTAGTMYWRVRTYNIDDVAGPWGTSAANVIQAKPVTPILFGVTSTPRFMACWQSVGQQAYQFTVTNSTGNTVFDSGEVYGADKCITVDDYLADGNYTLSLKIQNGLGVWSDTATQVIHIKNSQQPGDDTLSATSVFGGVKLTLSLPEPTGASYIGDDVYVSEVYLAHQPYYAAGDRYILRDGIPIAKITGTTYIDYTASGLHQYVCRVVYQGNYHDSNVVFAASSIKYACIARLEAPDSVMILKFNEGEAPKSDNQLTKVVNSNYYSGRALPVYDVTEHHSSAWNYTYSLLSQNDFETILTLFNSGGPIIFRDWKGNRSIGILTALKKVPSKRNGIQIGFTIEESDAEEAVIYD